MCSNFRGENSFSDMRDGQNPDFSWLFPGAGLFSGRGDRFFGDLDEMGSHSLDGLDDGRAPHG